MQYNLDYYEEMLRRNSKSAEEISAIRWKFISIIKPNCILDYGSGVGWFRAYKPQGVEVDTYDIGRYPQTGILHENYSIITFWDVLEHLSGFNEIEDVLKMTNYVAFSVPIKPIDEPLRSWKHFKPGEHLHYFTDPILNDVFRKYGFTQLIGGHPECPPRKDILSAIYQRF